MTSLARRGLLELRDRARSSGGRWPAAPRRRAAAVPAGATLDAEQAAVAGGHHVPRSTRGGTTGFLLEGATASGKTAVYAAAIAAALAAGRGALVLVPEIALAVPLVDRLRHDLGDGAGAAPQRARGGGARRRVAAHRARRRRRVVVGTRMAVLAPIADPSA